MKTSQVSTALRVCIKARLPVLLHGAPGAGKSDLARAAANDEKADWILSHPVVHDPTDYKGLPWPSEDKTFATFLPYADLARVLRAKKKTVWFLDDLGQAPPAVQAAAMQLLLARCIGDHKIPDCVTFLAATNGRAHRANVSGILEPVKSRFVTLIEVVPDLDDWIIWAYGASISPMVISFLRFRSELFSKFEATGDMKNSPSPRTWSHVSDLIKAGVPPELEQEMFGGAVGSGAGDEFTGFCRVFRDLPSLDGIILDPEKARIPTETSALYAVASGLAYKAKKTNIGKIIRYTERLAEAGHGEYAAYTLQDCEKRHPEINTTADWTAMLLTELGALYRP
jgi:Viral (Superfamily 1) RNA helicase